MAIIDHGASENTLSEIEIAAWRVIPTAIASDDMNRTSTADAGIRPVTKLGPLVGLAVTVRVAAGDNLALHHAVSRPGHGKILVIDAGGYLRTAVWGGILHKAAEKQGYIGVIVDGCIRDVAEIRESRLACYTRGIVPAGPHKGWGGEINGPVQFGGVVVRPGDLVLGDEDGLAIVPYPERAAILEKCRARLANEASTLQRLDAGETTVQIFNL
jgi:RraA family protein